MLKIIDLLNLVYEEKAPKKILYKYCEYEFNSDINDYQNKDGLELFSYLFSNKEQALYLDIKIIEGVGKPIFRIDDNGYIHTETGSWKGRKMDIEIVKAINYLLKKDKEGE